MSSYNKTNQQRQRQQRQQRQQQQQQQQQQQRQQQRQQQQQQQQRIENDERMRQSRIEQQIENDRLIQERNRTTLNILNGIRSIFVFEIRLNDLLYSLPNNYETNDNNIINDYDIYDNYDEYELFQEEKEPDTISSERFNKFKKVIYNNSKKDLEHNECIICTCEYKNNDKILKLDCDHCYHEKCIKKWLLEESNKCPLCNKIY